MPIDHSKTLHLAALGNWESAHELVQPHDDSLSCQIHGYLHRVEGDLDNAAYWYSRAGRAMPNNTLAEELARLRKLVAIQ